LRLTNGEEVFFLVGEVGGDLGDGFVGHGLDLFFEALGVVFGELRFFEIFEAVAADVSRL
jgi:hypothetical protein